MTQRRWLRAIAVVYPLLTTFAVMATGNHFLADAVAGAAITGAVFFALSRTPIRAWLGWQPRVAGAGSHPAVGRRADPRCEPESALSGSGRRGRRE